MMYASKLLENEAWFAWRAETKARIAAQQELLEASKALVNLVEGVGCTPYEDPLTSARFKDAVEWARFYVAAKNAARVIDSALKEQA